MQHQFIFQEGLWIGEGKITFSASPDHIHFYTRWNIVTLEPVKSPKIFHWLQEVEMRGSDDRVKNHFVFTLISPTTFSLTLENDLVGKVIGKGLFDAKKIAWELKGSDTFQGFEVYELQENGDYMLHAEYAAPDNFRTTIDGRIWLKSS